MYVPVMVFLRRIRAAVMVFLREMALGGDGVSAGPTGRFHSPAVDVFTGLRELLDALADAAGELLDDAPGLPLAALRDKPVLDRNGTGHQRRRPPDGSACTARGSRAPPTRRPGSRGHDGDVRGDDASRANVFT